jgi:ribosomal protein S18 acetylase RimI-like enzyme
MNLRFRVATTADHPFLRRLDRAAYEPLAVRLFGAWDEAKQRARMDYKLRELRFRIIEQGGRAVGAVATSEHEDHVFLHEMMILPEHQNRGLGSLVLESELRDARALGKPLRLHTARLNRAQELYKRHGFRVTGGDEMFINMESPCPRP